MIDPWFPRELRALATEGDGTEGLERTYRSVDTCAAEFEAPTPYFYQAMRGGRMGRRGRKGEPLGRHPRLGSQPDRAGDRVRLLLRPRCDDRRELERDAVMINCNPETVSTDYDTSDRLYFEPLTTEDVLAVCAIERPEGVIVQFGGQTLCAWRRRWRRRGSRCSAPRSTRSTSPRTAVASARC